MHIHPCTSEILRSPILEYMRIFYRVYVNKQNCVWSIQGLFIHLDKHLAALAWSLGCFSSFIQPFAETTMFHLSSLLSLVPPCCHSSTVMSVSIYEICYFVKIILQRRIFLNKQNGSEGNETGQGDMALRWHHNMFRLYCKRLYIFQCFEILNN